MQDDDSDDNYEDILAANEKNSGSLIQPWGLDALSSWRAELRVWRPIDPWEPPKKLPTILGSLVKRLTDVSKKMEIEEGLTFGEKWWFKRKWRVWERGLKGEEPYAWGGYGHTPPLAPGVILCFGGSRVGWKVEEGQGENEGGWWGQGVVPLGQFLLTRWQGPTSLLHLKTL